MTATLSVPPAVPLSSAAAEEFWREGRVLLKVDLNETLRNVMKQLDWFFGQPEEFRDGFAIRELDDDADDVGYFDKKKEPRKKGGFYDDKAVFMYRSRARAEYNACPGGESPEMRAFFGAMSVAFWQCCDLAERFFQALDRVKPGFDLLKLFRSEHACYNHVFRGLGYRRLRQRCQQLGKPHVDRDGISFALTENLPGLRLQPDGPESEGIAHASKPGEVLVFAGSKLESATGGLVKGLNHVIKSPPEVDVDSPSRRSAVFFAHL